MLKKMTSGLLGLFLVLSSVVACTQQTSPVDTSADTTLSTETSTQASTATLDMEADTISDTEADTQASTTLETTQEDIMPVEPLTIEDRYFIYRIWNFTPRSISTFKYIVDAAVADGFNAIKVHIPWHRVETVAGEYDYTAFDEMIDYVVNEKGLKVAVSLDLTRRKGDTVLSEDDIMRDSAGNLCMGGSETGDRLQISLNSPTAVNAAVAFYGDAVAHYHHLYGDAVLFYLPAFSQYCETEYWCTAEYDYSDHAVEAFQSYLQEQYQTIEALNAVLSAEYASFGDVVPPSASSATDLGHLWYVFRHESLKTAVDALADAQTAVAPDTKFAIQIGCAYDQAASVRGTLGIADLCEKVDVLWVDDGPLMNHHFTMDYIRSQLPASVELAQEIDGPHQYGASPENYLAQGMESFARGCTYVSIANWGINDDYENYRHVWQEISATWLCDNPPDILQPTADMPVLKVSLSKMLGGKGIDRYLNSYKRLAPNGEFVYIEVEDDLTTTKP